MEGRPVVLESERLSLEPLRPEHAGALFEALSEPALYAYLPTVPPASVEALAERYGRLVRGAPPGSGERWLNWVPRLRDGGACVGRVEVTLRAGPSAYLAYELGAAWHGRGLATEACARVLRELFEAFDVAFVVAEVDTRNERSWRLLERLGFARVGRREDADFFDGATSHEYDYRLERAAWEREAARSASR